MLGLFLQPDAVDRIRAMPLDPVVREHALELLEKGYTVVRGAIPPADCKAMIDNFRRFEAENSAIFMANRDQHGHYPKIVNLHTAMPELTRLFTRNRVWLAVQDTLFGAPTSLYTSILYESGSEQSLHRDTPLFTTRPEYLYFGTTVYLERADDENGCLQVMEGGHKLTELDRSALALARYGSLDKIPDWDMTLWNEYQETVTKEGLARGLKIKRLHVNEGDSLIWHPQLPHGGSPIADRSRTRFSFVMHTTPSGVPVYQQSAFFNPKAPRPKRAGWFYTTIENRRVADFRTAGVDFGHVNIYGLDKFVSSSGVVSLPDPGVMDKLFHLRGRVSQKVDSVRSR